MANTSNGANLGFENDLWRAADALRSNMDAAEYKHVVLGLNFLKYISDAFEEQHAKLDADRFHRDLHPDLKAHYITANSPFEISSVDGTWLCESKPSILVIELNGTNSASFLRCL